jgi:uracil DNA glycosylase superfamily protein
MAIAFRGVVVHAFDFDALGELSHENVQPAVVESIPPETWRSMSSQSVEGFVRLLKQKPPGAVFNPWWEIDEQNDIGQIAPKIRRQQLSAYLHQLLGRAKIVVIGEALGYRGGHFTGIPMTSERILLGRKPNILAALYEGRNLQHGISNGGPIPPTPIVSCIEPRRTSKPSVCPHGFSEPTATIVWAALLKLGFLPHEFVLWNAFPWHSFDPHRGMLSNRSPNKSEQLCGRAMLNVFLKLFRCETIVSLGKIAAAQLEQLGVKAHCVRHPASGGAKLFRQQIARVR